VASNGTGYALDTEYQDMLDQFDALFRQINPMALTASSAIAAERVSPHDLERSPNLKLIGRLNKNVS
jgi:hypothetical protein